MTKALTGRVPADAIGMLEIPRLPGDLLDAYCGLGDLTGLVSDAMDALEITDRAVASSVLRPTDPSARIVAQAITVLNRRRDDSPGDAVRAKDNRLGDIEGHNLAQPGDVLVIQGVDLVSSMGSISAAIGRRQGELGAIVDGAVRDIDSSRAIGYAVWARSTSPITGKWRLRTVGVNVPVMIAGVTVAPGDLVIADEVGVCFVPCARAAEVLAMARTLAASEQKRQGLIAAGMPVPDLATAK